MLGVTWGRSMMLAREDVSETPTSGKRRREPVQVPSAPEPVGLHEGRTARVELPGGIQRGMVRAEPNLGAPILERLTRRTEVRLVELSSDQSWWRVTGDTLPASGGWMHRDLLRDPALHAFGTEAVELGRWVGSYELYERCQDSVWLRGRSRTLTMVVTPTGGSAPSARLEQKLASHDGSWDVALRLSSRGIDVLSIPEPGSAKPQKRLFGLAEDDRGLVTEWGAYTPLCGGQAAATSLGPEGFQRTVVR